MSLQQKIDRITDILRRDDGISGAMHYTEQTSWVLFLKFLDDYESGKEDDAILSGKHYQQILDKEHRWSNWACPKDADGKFDINKARTGDDLTDYVNKELFPYLKGFANATVTGGADPKSFAYKIGAIFQYLDNKVASGHTLREVLDIIDTLNFQSNDEMFELSQVYEGLLQNMGDAGGYAGEFYTPRSVVRAMVKVLDPQPLDKIYDGAAGSCGFLVDAFEYNKPKTRKERGARELTSEEYDFQRLDAYWGFEKTSLAYVMGMMNMILHGIESPNLYRGNTLTQDIRAFEEKDRYNIILANPPFGGKEKSQIQQNFPIQSNATELLFMQHFMKTLKSGGKAAIVIPEGVLFQTNSAFKQVKQELLGNFNLHTILSLPAGVFLPYSGVKTNVLFFERSGGTSDVWYYECEPEQKLTKNKPITDEHLKEFVKLYVSRETTPCSWTVSANKLAEDYDISAKNPVKQKVTEHLAPSNIINQVRTREILVAGLLDEIDELLKTSLDGQFSVISERMTIESLVEVKGGKRLPKGEKLLDEKTEHPYIRVADFNDKGTIDLSDIKYITSEIHEKIKRYVISKNDLYISIAGTIGKTGFVPPELDGANLTENAAKLVIKDKEQLDLSYLYLFTLTSDFAAQAGLATKTVAQPKLALTRLSKIEVPMCSLEEQKALVATIEALKSKIHDAEEMLLAKINDLQSLKASILDSAFKGEL